MVAILNGCRLALVLPPFKTIVRPVSIVVVAVVVVAVCGGGATFMAAVSSQQL